MKKILGVGLSCFMALTSVVPVFASETCHISGCNMGECFKDEDCDGICGDHAFVDEDGDGICDNHCFFDDDADGICDHCHEHGKPVPAVNSQNVYRSNGHHRSSHKGRHCGH